ncbi:uncharacterized protein LOC115693531 [Syzygium oleosum]|uniref:uncharacterized protein LOC115693531 n=1 Tax=Syzygium oleosum TaxID=219896 RepID=UPI0011D1E092|nr:uncharacterized protein LOC115693531 [Syzygium oleosum]
MEDHEPDWNFASWTRTTASTTTSPLGKRVFSGAPPQAPPRMSPLVPKLVFSSTIISSRQLPQPLSESAEPIKEMAFVTFLMPCKTVNLSTQQEGKLRIYQNILYHFLGTSYATQTKLKRVEVEAKERAISKWMISDNAKAPDTVASGFEFGYYRDADRGMREKLEDQRKARVRRTRSAEQHDMSERKRRGRIKDKIKTLQQLIPNCSKSDRASVLDDAVKYLKRLKLQVEMSAMGAAGGALTLNPYMSPAISATGIDNMNQGSG